MKVFCVYYGYKDDELQLSNGELETIFSTREKAQNYIKDHQDGLIMSYWIEEKEVL